MIYFSIFALMNKGYFLKCAIFLLIGCCACHPIKIKKPDPLLPMDSVAVLVADSYFLEGEIYVMQRKYDVQEYAMVKYDSFFLAHGITKEIFVNNVEYYFTNEKFAEKIMDRVDTIVEQRVTALRDSLNIKQ